MHKYLRYVFIAAMFLSVCQAHAGFSPAAVALFAPVEFPPSDYSVTGLRVSALLGKHRDVYGFDLAGLGNITEQSFGGIAVAGLFNMTQGTTTILGLQLAGAANINTNKTRVFGLQATLGVNSNLAESMVAGLQLGLLGNYSPFIKVIGAQIGVYNRANEVYGFQIGLVNVAESLHGIQIGLINFNHKGLFSVAPLINVGF